MARVRSEPSNRAKKRKGNLKVWSDGDRLQLLAYLDWCAHSEVDFRATAIDHLRNVTGKDFSRRQIGDKLKREWSKEKKCPDFEDVYALGRAAFSPLNHEEEDALQRTIARIKPPNSQMRLRSASSELTMTIRSRSLAISVPTTPTSSNRRSARLARSHTSLEPPSATEMTIDGSDGMQAVSPIHFWSVKDAGLEAPMSAGIIQDDDDSDLSSVHSSACPVIEFDSELRELNKVCEEVSSISASGLALDSRIDSEILHAELLHYKGSVFSLRNRLSEVERELEELQNSMQATSGTEFVLKQQVYNLRARLESTHLLSCQVDAYNTECLGLSSSDTSKEYDNLLSNISENYLFIRQPDADMNSDMDADEVIPEPSGDFCRAAESWSIKASSRRLDQLLSYCRENEIPGDRLFPALVAAGISELVFEQVFPDIMALDSPLLNEYRKHILTKDGLSALRQLDLIALKSLTSYEHFTSDMIASEAKKLSEIILSTLRCFLPVESHFVSEEQPESEHDRLSVAALTNTLSRVLLFKVQLMLSGKRLKFFFFKPGEPFDETMMKRDDWHFQVSTNDHQGLKRHGGTSTNYGHVKLCLLPALYASPGEEYNQRFKDFELEWPTSYHKCITQALPHELPSLILVEKGVVLL